MRTRKEIDVDYQMECMKAGDLLNRKNLLTTNLSKACEALEKAQAKMKALCEELSSEMAQAEAPKEEIQNVEAAVEECKKED